MGKKPTRVREITQVRTRHIRDYKPQEQVNGHKPLFPEPQEEIPFVPEPDLVLVDTIWRGLLTEEELIPKYEEKTISIPRAHFPLSKLDPISTASVSKKTIFPINFNAISLAIRLGLLNYETYEQLILSNLSFNGVLDSEMYIHNLDRTIKDNLSNLTPSNFFGHLDFIIDEANDMDQLLRRLRKIHLTSNPMYSFITGLLDVTENIICQYVNSYTLETGASDKPIWEHIDIASIKGQAEHLKPALVEYAKSLSMINRHADLIEETGYIGEVALERIKADLPMLALFDAIAQEYLGKEYSSSMWVNTPPSCIDDLFLEEARHPRKGPFADTKIQFSWLLFNQDPNMVSEGTASTYARTHSRIAKLMPELSYEELTKLARQWYLDASLNKIGEMPPDIEFKKILQHELTRFCEILGRVGTTLDTNSDKYDLMFTAVPPEIRSALAEQLIGPLQTNGLDDMYKEYHAAHTSLPLYQFSGSDMIKYSKFRGNPEVIYTLLKNVPVGLVREAAAEFEVSETLTELSQEEQESVLLNIDEEHIEKARKKIMTNYIRLTIYKTLDEFSAELPEHSPSENPLAERTKEVYDVMRGMSNGHHDHPIVQKLIRRTGLKTTLEKLAPFLDFKPSDLCGLVKLIPYGKIKPLCELYGVNEHKVKERMYDNLSVLAQGITS